MIKLLEKIRIKTEKQLYGGFLGVCVIVLMSIILFAVRGFNGMDRKWIISISADIFGIAMCSIMYYGCINGSSQTGNAFLFQDIRGHIHSKKEHKPESMTIVFATLIIVNVIGMFLDEICWCVQGLPQFVLLNKTANVLFYSNNFTELCMFWGYALQNLRMNRKTMRIVGHLFRILYPLSIVINFSNLFVPVYFSVDAGGVYQREPLFPISQAILIIVIPPLMDGLITSESSKKEKSVILSFILLPLFMEIMSIFKFGISLQQPAAALSVFLIYSVLVSDYEKKLKANQTELNMAASIQSSMMPQKFPPFPERKEFDIYASMTPAKDVGGDFYDFFLTDDDHLCMVIADVSGKGVPASLFMMASKIVIKNCAMQGNSVADIFYRTNRAICANNTNDMFVTVWLGILEISTGRLTAANAGHEYPIVTGKDGSFSLLRDKHGIVIGAMDMMKYREYEIILEKGSKLFLYTDGLPEASDKDNNMFGIENTVKTLNENKDASPKELVRNIYSSVKGFVRDAEQFDDLTMLCIEYMGNQDNN